jgi:hypothetical protein
VKLYGNYTNLTVKIRGYYCDNPHKSNLGFITQKKVKLATDLLRYKIQGKLINIKFANNYELYYIHTIDDNTDIAEYMLKNKVALKTNKKKSTKIWL